MPTCVAASPTPGAAYMVSNMSSTSFLSSASNLVTGSAGVVSTGSGQVTIFKRAILYYGIPCLSVFASKDRKSTRLNSSHDQISYAVFCLKKKKRVLRVIGRVHCIGRRAGRQQLRRGEVTGFHQQSLPAGRFFAGQSSVHRCGEQIPDAC